MIIAMLRAKHAQIAWKLADLTKAAELSDLALATFLSKAPNSSQFITALNLEAMILNDTGKLKEAYNRHERALALSTKLVGGDSLKVRILNNMGTLATARGDFVAASTFLQRAVAVLHSRGERSAMLAMLLINLGGLYHEQEDFDQAELFFKKSLALYKEFAPNTLGASSAMLNLGRVAIAKGNLEVARRMCKDSLKFRSSRLPADSFLLTSPLDCLSLIAEVQKNFSEARKIGTRVLRIIETHAPASLTLADSLSRLYSITFAQDDLEAAEIYAKRAEAIYRALAPETYYHAGALQAIALIRFRQGRLEEAAGYFSQAISAAEFQLSRAHESEVERGAYRSSRRDLYENYVSCLLLAGRPEESFQVLERWRAGAFLAMLSERDLVFSDVPQELNAELRRLSVDYDRTSQKVKAATAADNPEAIQAWRDELTALRVKQGEIAKSIRRASPKNAAISYPQPLDFKSARESLDPGTAMLAYCIMPGKIYLFIIIPNQPLKALTLLVGEQELTQQIARLRDLLKASPVLSDPRMAREKAFHALARKLFDELIAPATPLLQDRSRLVIINDGALHMLPWNSLIRSSTQEERPGSSRSWQYMTEWKPIHIALSATAYKELKELPRYPNTDANFPPRFIGFGVPLTSLPMPSGKRPAQTPKERSWDFGPLPSSRVEIQEIANLYSANAGVYFGADATEENAKTLPRDTRIVHFATHATLDERSPLDSAVVLSIPEKFEEGKDNGLLQAWEIFERVRIDADLVVLSACESGLGKEMGGEGLIGLTRAFQYAGARSVMASLWKISDRTTAELMVRFYKHLKAGLPKDEALRAAQMELIRGPIQVKNEKGDVEEIDASAPYYWAAFQIYGDWQ